jgi:hypothetical protein
MACYRVNFTFTFMAYVILHGNFTLEGKGERVFRQVEIHVPKRAMSYSRKPEF